MEAAAQALSLSAENYVNDPVIEQQWAIKAFQHSEIYFNLLCAIADPKSLRLTPNDDKIYGRFREMFPDFNVDVLDENTLKTEQAKQKWREFCEQFRDFVEDYNFGTLVRTRADGEYSEENTILLVRIQFYAIEIARNREGYNSRVRHLYGTKKESVS
ncbi:unnamed protein product [Didymodactylos carnosus]|uniref:Polysaccharide biosynthesis domain-containing protein n=1 Tax=Didymodactylos carnosus TaxID=1234261 RepID=A0A814QYX2_9BILA|nr:unnamed protein product [Didymodactylos carnosus]CAF1126463.1 unnamed protein product [Didymodactylos carnosus]CAF3501731.1 unnamed protein product [Didymodactylos carnosus]CAF3890010.1 unnamed protein product [Didymodactylos carnosus]